MGKLLGITINSPYHYEQYIIGRTPDNSWQHGGYELVDENSRVDSITIVTDHRDNEFYKVVISNSNDAVPTKDLFISTVCTGLEVIRNHEE